MSAFGAYPAVAQAVRACRRPEPPPPLRLGWFVLACACQLALFLALDALVNFPWLFD